MDLLRTEFDDKCFPHRFLLKVPESGGLGLILRLSQAAENLGIKMLSARQRISADESDDGEAHFLVGVALPQANQYPALMAECDRLSAEHHRGVIETLSEAGATAHADLLLRDHRDGQLTSERPKGPWHPGLVDDYRT